MKNMDVFLKMLIVVTPADPHKQWDLEEGRVWGREKSEKSN